MGEFYRHNINNETNSGRASVERGGMVRDSRFSPTGGWMGANIVPIYNINTQKYPSTYIDR